jgi:hydroxymethylbilane synthase
VTLRIGTRGSELALWQARSVARILKERAGQTCELVTIRTTGDEPPDPPITLGTSGTSVKGTFVKEIEDALCEGRIDLAVHSSKDLSAVLPEGLVIAATLPREDPRDALVLPASEQVDDLDVARRRLGDGPRIGTSSVRRAAQLASLFSSASFIPLRGNVGTRLRKLDEGSCDAIVLAAAGLKRLDRADRISLALPADACIPAPGQGIVSIEIQRDRRDLAHLLQNISDDRAMDSLIAERAIVAALGGGCQMPLGALAEVDGSAMTVRAVVVTQDGTRAVRCETSGRRDDAKALGESLAKTLLDCGAAEILRRP